MKRNKSELTPLIGTQHVASTGQGNSSYLAVYSSDGAFMRRLVEWLASQSVAPGSTVIRVHDADPYEEADLLRAQIEGMKIRMFDAEQKLREMNDNV